ncbi:hypothetical protein AHAS_Ahas04G0211300 [Arachis hypogaea]
MRWLLVLLVQLLLCSSELMPKIHMTIQNYMEGHESLIVPCKSKEDDIGARLVKYIDTYEFEFRVNFFGGKFFFCNFQWLGVCHWFKIYNEDRN